MLAHLSIKALLQTLNGLKDTKTDELAGRQTDSGTDKAEANDLVTWAGLGPRGT